MSIYSENLEFLKKNASGLYKIVTESKPVFDCRAEYFDKLDNFILEKGDTKCYLYSCYDKKHEITKIFENMPEDTEIVVLFGLGNGRAVEYLKNLKSARHVIVIEPMVAIFQQFLKKHNLKESGSYKRMTFIVNTDAQKTFEIIKTLMLGEFSKKLHIAFHISYRTVFKDYYDEILKNVIRLIRSERMQIMTNYVSYKKWTLNYISNLNADCLPVEAVEEFFKGRPAVLVSAGPSLNKNIEYLNEIKSKAIIIAGGSAIKILESHGIKPHFRIAFDGSEKEKELIFDCVEKDEVPLIFTDQLNKDIIPNYYGMKFRMNTFATIIPQYVLKSTGIPFQIFPAGISVANVTLGLLCGMGCSQVIFVGQDMCFFENKLFAEGRGEQENADQHESRLMDAEDIYGNKVKSIIQYLQIKYGLEEIIKLEPAVRFINATEGGLGLEGTENMTLKNVLEKELTKDLDVDLAEYLKNLKDQNTESTYNHKILEGIKKLYLDLKEVIEINTQILSIYKGLNSESGKLNRQKEIKLGYEFMSKLEKERDKLDFVKSVVNISMKSLLMSGDLSDKSNGKETNKENMNMDAVEKIIGRTANIMEFCLLMKVIIEEAFEQDIQDIRFSSENSGDENQLE